MPAHIKAALTQVSSAFRLSAGGSRSARGRGSTCSNTVTGRIGARSCCISAAEPQLNGRCEDHSFSEGYRRHNPASEM